MDARIKISINLVLLALPHHQLSTFLQFLFRIGKLNDVQEGNEFSILLVLQRFSLRSINEVESQTISETEMYLNNDPYSFMPINYSIVTSELASKCTAKFLFSFTANFPAKTTTFLF